MGGVGEGDFGKDTGVEAGFRGCGAVVFVAVEGGPDFIAEVGVVGDGEEVAVDDFVSGIFAGRNDEAGIGAEVEEAPANGCRAEWAEMRNGGGDGGGGAVRVEGSVDEEGVGHFGLSNFTSTIFSHQV